MSALRRLRDPYPALIRLGAWHRFHNVMQLMGCTSVEQIRAEGREMLDTSRLFDHYDPNPTDWHYQPVNVFTHGQLPDGLMQQAAAAPSDAVVTETTTVTTTHPDGTIESNSTTTTGPARL